MKLELTEEEADILEEALSFYCNDIVKICSYDLNYVAIYDKAMKAFSNVQKQLQEQDK